MLRNGHVTKALPTRLVLGRRVQNEALEEIAVYGEVPLSWCRKTAAARGSSWHRSGINGSGSEVPGL